jgi:hypothetical protein
MIQASRHCGLLSIEIEAAPQATLRHLDGADSERCLD